MALKSFVLSVLLTVAFGYIFMVGIFSKSFFLNKLPDWANMTIMVAGGVLYILAFWWGIKGFMESKLLSLMGLGLSSFGIMVYMFFIYMEFNHGKATPGQFDYQLDKISATEKKAVLALANQIGFNEKQIVITEYWELRKFPMAICIQKGHVIGVEVHDNPVKDVSVLSDLTELSGLYLRNTNLKSLEGLKLPRLNRLELQNNHFTNLKTFSGLPDLEWLFMEKNELTSLDGIEQMPKLKETNFSNNPVSEASKK